MVDSKISPYSADALDICGHTYIYDRDCPQ